ncbi:hypothetical protein [Leuconostoc gasicomitatum]|uniref:hypothetical protein n=1 Tax=Leuconostoc gasicomitatum TaxID=115778 RepID=UPI0015C95E7B|nr:hypothetical protein [Leuconostoc gasicomitatum]QLG77577.1 hypothetical protein LeuG3613_01365 [Leuconostoc gasicomitatum]
MRYNDRVKIIFNQNFTNDGWDDEVKAVTSDWLPCRITGVGDKLNMGVFGKYESGAQAIHFKNKVPNMDYVLIDGSIKRKPAVIKQARKNTVVVIGAM